jgi:hypothetical protein
MAWGKINNLEIDAPSSFQELRDVIGGFNTTMTGSRRRYIKAIKKSWKISYDILTNTEYQAIVDEYDTLIPSGLQIDQPYATLTIYDERYTVSGEIVHMEIGERNIIPGTDILSNIEITFLQL